MEEIIYNIVKSLNILLKKGVIKEEIISKLNNKRTRYNISKEELFNVLFSPRNEYERLSIDETKLFAINCMINELLHDYSDNKQN